LQQWNEVDRRNGGGERRGLSDRRASSERRFDYRGASLLPKRSLKSWLRSISKARLGVDRRKGLERRYDERRSQQLRSLLTPEEIAALLQD